MKHQLPSPVSYSSMLLIAAGAFAIGVFVLDTFTPLEAAGAVLYVVALLLVSSFFQRRGILLVAAGCIALTVLSYLLQHELSADAGSWQSPYKHRGDRNHHRARFEKPNGKPHAA